MPIEVKLLGCNESSNPLSQTWYKLCFLRMKESPSYFGDLRKKLEKICHETWNPHGSNSFHINLAHSAGIAAPL